MRKENRVVLSKMNIVSVFDRSSLFIFCFFRRKVLLGESLIFVYFLVFGIVLVRTWSLFNKFLTIM